MLSQSKSSDNIARFVFNIIGYSLNLIHLALFSYSIYTNMCIQLPYQLQQVRFNYFLAIIVEILFLVILTSLSYCYLRSFIFTQSVYTTKDIKEQEQAEMDYKNYCQKCQKYKAKETKHCFYCNKCVLGYKQHCFLFSNCITNKNYKYMISLIVVSFIWYSFSVYFDILQFVQIYMLNDVYHLLKVLPALLLSFFFSLCCQIFSLGFLIYNYFLILNNLSAVEYIYGKFEGKCKIYGIMDVIYGTFNRKQRNDMYKQFVLNYKNIVGPFSLKEMLLPS